MLILRHTCPLFMSYRHPAMPSTHKHRAVHHRRQRAVHDHRPGNEVTSLLVPSTGPRRLNSMAALTRIGKACDGDGQLLWYSSQPSVVSTAEGTIKAAAGRECRRGRLPPRQHGSGAALRPAGRCAAHAKSPQAVQPQGECGPDAPPGAHIPVLSFFILFPLRAWLAHRKQTLCIHRKEGIQR